jgi:hypothetical protein
MKTAQTLILWDYTEGRGVHNVLMVEALEQFAAIEDCGPWAQDLIDGIKAWGGA